jgi:hypothetical protein
MERRSNDRCPTCQGPAVNDESKPEGIRCRTSICIQNHKDKACPRCAHKDLESVRFKNGKYEYTCRECTNIWETQ